MRYFLKIAYNGMAFHGWQCQPNAHTVQQTLEEALATILRTEVPIVAAGRTDTGVHASAQYAHFDFPEPLTERLAFKLNGYLDEHIAIRGFFTADDDAHARFSATSRSYVYRFILEKSPLWYERAWLLKTPPLDWQAMQAAADTLLEYEDFASFCKTGGGNKTTLCKVTEARFNTDSQIVEFHISANRFLRGMVRAVVGTLIDVGKSKLNVDDFRRIIEAQDRSRAGMAAPPQGLYLCGVGYPTGLLQPLYLPPQPPQL
ncbi:MAG: tRNA pseudouridine(38-40) synthase TruA [Bacteroidota bacterium]